MQRGGFCAGAPVLGGTSFVWPVLTSPLPDLCNHQDPEDSSFDPYSPDFPRVELEYPNIGASERSAAAAISSASGTESTIFSFFLVEPRDVEHYNPFQCLENSLHTIIEREYLYFP